MCTLFIGAAAIVVFAPGLIAPWSRLNNEEQELDLSSGRARFTRYVLYCQVSQEVRNTAISKALGSSRGSEGDEGWVMVNIFQPGVSHSPHFLYHGAFSQITGLEIHWDMADFTQDARAETARQLLKVWRDGGSDSAADRYLDNLAGTVVWDSGQPTTADAIPDDLAQKSLTEYDGKHARDH
ncbi:MAG: hypothetical protein GX591_04035 [Planctomycetes bacterium]|nr:hypothetical protein [Planctomycetota bacterium]